MRVLFFIESLRAGGKERRIVELLKAFKNDYPDVEIVLALTRKEIHYQEIYRLNIPIYFIERWLIKKDPSVLFRFYWLAKKVKPDIIHAWGHMVAFYSVPSKKILSIPLVNNEITDATPAQKLIAKSWVFNSSEKIIANTRAGLLAYGAPENKSSVIYNGFNFKRLENISNADVAKRKFQIETKYVVAMVASFSDHKDYETYLAAAELSLKRNPDITFLCVGDGDYLSLQTRFSNPQIRFLGKQNEVETIMNFCDVGVLATNTRNHEEGISNALLEFMALGKPVIATNSGGSKELITNGITGFLTEPFNAEELSEKTVFLLENVEEAKKIGLNARGHVEENFSIERMVKAFYKEYQSVLNI